MIVGHGRSTFETISTLTVVLKEAFLASGPGPRRVGRPTVFRNPAPFYQGVQDHYEALPHPTRTLRFPRAH